MRVDRNFLLHLLLQLLEADSTWHDVELLDEELLLEEEKLLFHLEQLFDQGFLTHRPAAGKAAPGGQAGFSLHSSELRLTAQGLRFSEGLLLQARKEATWEKFMRQRWKPAERKKEDTEHCMYGLDDIRFVFTPDKE